MTALDFRIILYYAYIKMRSDDMKYLEGIYDEELEKFLEKLIKVSTLT